MHDIARWLSHLDSEVGNLAAPAPAPGYLERAAALQRALIDVTEILAPANLAAITQPFTDDRL